MDDYPRNIGEFEARFATEEACRAYLCRLRWPDGFRCRCGEANAWWTARGLWHCAACGAQTSVTAGTVFQDTRKPLRMWLLGRRSEDLQVRVGYRTTAAWDNVSCS
jgi:hypothetical protein